MLSPVYYEGCSASELIDSLKCECGVSQMCSTGCPCYQSGMPCIEFCSCAATDICNNVLTTIQENIEHTDE